MTHTLSHSQLSGPGHEPLLETTIGEMQKYLMRAEMEQALGNTRD